MDAGLGLAFVGFMVVVVGILGVLAMRRDRRRLQGLPATARALGLTYEALSPATLERLRPRLGVLRFPGQGPQVVNRIAGAVDGVTVEVFDFGIRIPFRGRQRLQEQTVAVVTVPGKPLPAFNVDAYVPVLQSRLPVPSGTMRKVELTGHPGFARGYVLKAADEAAVRGLFAAPVVACIEALVPPASLECDGSLLALYRVGVVAQPDDVEPLIRTALALTRLLVAERDRSAAG